MTVDDIRVVERPGGIRIPYVVVGSGPRRILFGHSLLASGTAGAAVFQPMVDAGWTVVAMDQRGHGASTGATQQADFALDDLGADLLAIMDDLGWDTAWLGGGSMGAATSMAALGLAPDRAEGLLAVAPAIGRAVNPALERFVRIGRAFETEGVEAGLTAWADETAPVPVAEMHLHALRAMGAEVAGSVLQALASWAVPRTFEVLPTLDIPIVASAWDGDPVHPLATAEDIAATAKHGTLHRLDLGGPDLFTACAQHLGAATS